MLKTYKKLYIFIFEEDKDKLDEYLKIAKIDYKCEKKVLQYDKNTNELIQSFSSSCEASRKLNILMSGINMCCQYYKYTDDTRPPCYKLKSFKGFIFKQTYDK